MGTNAEKLLAQARISKAGWTRNKLDKLYLGFGFIIRTGNGPHDKVFHPKHPELITWLPRHNKLGEYNITNAIKLIDKLIVLKEAENG